MILESRQEKLFFIDYSVVHEENSKLKNFCQDFKIMANDYNYEWQCGKTCQASTSKGQCNNSAVDGSNYCLAHGGNKQAIQNKKDAKRLYLLGKWRARHERHSEHEQIKSLREEIGILRMMIEEKLNQCSDEQDLLLSATPIADLVMKVEKLVVSCNKIESKLGNLLDKKQALQWVSEIIEIIANYIEDEGVLEDVSNEIVESLSRTG